MPHPATGQGSWTPDEISGTWHLVDSAADEVDIPSHRMDLRFQHAPGQLRAAVLSRVTGEEMLVIHGASFDGQMLRLQLVAPPGRKQDEMPTLTMTVAGAKLVGHWEQQGAVMGPEMKLVRQ